jgi:acyl-coenzyme A synthetase/AMP-(fatty) acid ligase
MPEARARRIIGELSPKVIVKESCPGIPTFEAWVHAGSLNNFAIYADSHTSGATLGGYPIDADPAYVVFTSGSTGDPKGIIMSHRAVVSFMRGLIGQSIITQDARYTTLSPLQFDLSLIDICLCLGTGATLVAPGRASLRKPRALIAKLARLHVTHFCSVPTVWRILMNSAAKAVCELEALRRIIFSGEHFPLKLMLEIERALPNVDFCNIYGQSESVACSAQVVTSRSFDSSGRLPVGRGHPNIELFLLDGCGSIIGNPDITGELYIGGTPLFSGYWRDPSATNQRLISDPRHRDHSNLVFRTGDNCRRDSSGLLYFVGRLDNQVKVNGNRVELEDIERALCSLEGIRIANSCTFVVQVDDQLVIHAAVVFGGSGWREDAELTLRTAVARLLPSYMWPRKYHFVDSIPLLRNGKTDRMALSKLLEGREESASR